MNAKKLELLKIINEKKTVLFPNNISAIPKQVLENAWLEILIKAQSLHLAGPERKWTYVRDCLFAEWKTATLEKYQKEEQIINKNMGHYLNEVDKLILDILNIDLREEKLEISKMKLKKKQNCRSQKSKLQNIKNSSNAMPDIKVEVVKNSSENTNEENLKIVPKSIKKRKMTLNNAAERTETKTFVNRSKRQVNDIDHNNDMEKQMRIELLEHDIYYRKLKCLRLERELFLPPSKYTLSLLKNEN